MGRYLGFNIEVDMYFEDYQKIKGSVNLNDGLISEKGIKDVIDKNDEEIEKLCIVFNSQIEKIKAITKNEEVYKNQCH